MSFLPKPCSAIIGNCGTQAADVKVVFDGDDTVFCAFDRLNDGRIGEWLERCDVHMSDGDASFL